eukprot:2855173-Amphidinium_carterae.1
MQTMQGEWGTLRPSTLHKTRDSFDGLRTGCFKSFSRLAALSPHVCNHLPGFAPIEILAKNSCDAYAPTVQVARAAMLLATLA